MFILKISTIDSVETICFPDSRCDVIIVEIIDALYNLYPDYYVSYSLMDCNGTFYVRRKDLPVSQICRDLPLIVMNTLVDMPAIVLLKKGD